MTQKASSITMTAIERRLQACQMRKYGATYQQIGDTLGITKQAAWKTVIKAITKANEKIIETAEQVRSIELERLDSLWKTMYTQAMKGNQGAVDRCLRIQERRAKLLGLDSPVKQETKSEHKLSVEYVNDWREVNED